MSELVYVYGTLRRGGSAEEKMQRATYLEPGTLFGRLHDCGWYPGLVLDPLAEEVTGDLYSVPEMLLPILDSYEGCSVSDPEPHEYRRVKSTVKTASGALCEAWVWEYHRDLEGREEIPGGDWIAYCAQQDKRP